MCLMLCVNSLDLEKIFHVKLVAFSFLCFPVFIEKMFFFSRNIDFSIKTEVIVCIQLRSLINETFLLILIGIRLREQEGSVERIYCMHFDENWWKMNFMQFYGGSSQKFDKEPAEFPCKKWNVIEINFLALSNVIDTYRSRLCTVLRFLKFFGIGMVIFFFELNATPCWGTATICRKIAPF